MRIILEDRNRFDLENLSGSFFFFQNISDIVEDRSRIIVFSAGNNLLGSPMLRVSRLCTILRGDGGGLGEGGAEAAGSGAGILMRRRLR